MENIRFKSLKEGLDYVRKQPSIRCSPETLGHVAQSIEYSLTGFPSSKSLLFQWTIGKIAARVFLFRGFMRHDLNAPIPGAPVIKNISQKEALSRLEGAVEAFSRFQGQLAPHFAYGKLSKEDYEKLQAFHLADHLRDF